MSEAQEEQARTKILLADDSKVIRTSAAKILGDEYDLLLAVDGQDAFDQLEQNKDVAAVFTDIGMPYLDGLGLLAKIREHSDELIKGIPVIVVTADETDEAREDALARGATDFITKPFNRVDMLARARSHAQAQREKRELEAHTTIDRLTGLGNEQHFLNALKDARDFSRAASRPHHEPTPGPHDVGVVGRERPRRRSPRPPRGQSPLRPGSAPPPCRSIHEIRA